MGKHDWEAITVFKVGWSQTAVYCNTVRDTASEVVLIWVINLLLTLAGEKIGWRSGKVGKDPTTFLLGSGVLGFCSLGSSFTSSSLHNLCAPLHALWIIKSATLNYNRYLLFFNVFHGGFLLIFPLGFNFFSPYFFFGHQTSLNSALKTLERSQSDSTLFCISNHDIHCSTWPSKNKRNLYLKWQRCHIEVF